jgi:hypothetical protein
MLDEYYQLHGWNIETGIPLPETVARLGLDQKPLKVHEAENIGYRAKGMEQRAF